MALAAQDGNLILAALPASYQEGFRAKLEHVSLRVHDSVAGPGKPPRFVYFPTTALISVVATVKEPSVSGIEVALIGREGMCGLPAFVGTETLPSRSFTQVAGEAFRMPASVFSEERKADPLADLVERYTHIFFNQVARVAACNGLHTVEERCARWLLRTHDQVGADTLLLTQEFLSQMLGVRRASVSVAAGILQHAGLIEYRHGKITIRDRRALEDAACECYLAIADAYKALAT